MKSSSNKYLPELSVIVWEVLPSLPTISMVAPGIICFVLRSVITPESVKFSFGKLNRYISSPLLPTLLEDK